MGSAFGLDRIKFLFTEKLLPLVSFGVLVVFQPELRRALMRLGETRLFRGLSQHIDEEVEAIVESAIFCSKRKIGAIIAVERDVGLGGIAESGTRINAELSAPLLNTIFFPNTELHDLGVVISQGRIAYAGVQFPMAESDELERELGARHRAAVGLSQESDAGGDRGIGRDRRYQHRRTRAAYPQDFPRTAAGAVEQHARPRQRDGPSPCGRMTWQMECQNLRHTSNLQRAMRLQRIRRHRARGARSIMRRAIDCRGAGCG